MTTSRRDGKVAELAAIPLFADLSDAALTRIARVGTETAVPAGAVLCRQGDYAMEFFIVVEGAAVAEANGIERATFSAGDFFGEVGLVQGGARLATVTTIVPTRVLVFQAAEFRTLIEDEPSIAMRLLYAVGGRYRDLAEHALS